MKKNFLISVQIFLIIARIYSQGAKGEGLTVAGAGIFPDQLYLPTAVCQDSVGWTYVVDRGNSRVQKFPVGSKGGTDGVTVGGGNGLGNAPNQLNQPYGMFVDKAGNVYVADKGNNRIQLFPAGSDSSTAGITVAGNDTAGNAANELNTPQGVYVDEDGSIYVADNLNNRVQKFPPGSRLGTPAITVAGGNGQGNGANQFYYPLAVCLDKAGAIYVADYNNNRIQKFGPGSTSDSSGVTVAGSSNSGSAAYQLYQPTDVFVDSVGFIYVMDYGNHRVQKFPKGSNENTNALTIAGGNGKGGANNQLDYASGIYVDALGNLYVADQDNDRVQFFTAGSTSASNGSTIAGGIGANNTADQLKGVEAAMLDGAGNLYVADLYNNRVQKFPPGSTATTPGVTVAGGNGYGYSANQLAYPNGLYVDSAGDIYVADQQNNRIQYFPAGSNSTTSGITVAGGNGYGVNANQLSYPTGVFLDATGNIYVADQYNNRVQKFPPNSTTNSNAVTVAGGNGAGSALNQLNSPRSIYVDNTGDLYVTSTNNHTVVKFPAGSTTATNGIIVAGVGYSGSAANQLSDPTGVWLDKDGSLYVADNINARVQKFPPNSDSSTNALTVAGGNGSGNAANQLNNPLGVFVDNSGNIYVSDDQNFRVQKWSQATNAVTQIKTGSITFEPNPIGDRFTVSVSTTGNKTINIFNSLGQLIYGSEMSNEIFAINSASWAPGMYICSIQADGQNYQSKLLKK